MLGNQKEVNSSKGVTIKFASMHIQCTYSSFIQYMPKKPVQRVEYYRGGSQQVFLCVYMYIAFTVEDHGCTGKGKHAM